jgi:hypothetical protein
MVIQGQPTHRVGQDTNTNTEEEGHTTVGVYPSVCIERTTRFYY